MPSSRVMAYDAMQTSTMAHMMDAKGGKKRKPLRLRQGDQGDQMQTPAGPASTRRPLRTK